MDHETPLLLLLVLVVAASASSPARAQSGAPTTAASDVEHPIQLSDLHPFYWAYEGEPTLLIGGSDDDNLFQWTGERLTDHLDQLTAVGGNYVRNTMSDRDEDDVYAFAEVEEGVYDLTEWNEEYWDRLEFFLQETSERDVIVQLTLWDHFDFHEGHPWHPSTNVNYGPEVVSDEEDFYGGSVLQENEELLAHQRRFVDKILSISLQYGNVLYNVNNEGSEPRTWDAYWASYLQEQAAEAGREIYVTSMMFDPSSSVRRAMTYRDIYAYTDISQNNQDSRGARGPAHYSNVLTWREKLEADPMPMNNVKIYGSGVGANYSAGTGKEATDRLWRNVFADSVRVRWLDVEEGSWSEPEVRSVEWEGALDNWGLRGRVRLTTPSNAAAVALVEVVEMP